MSIQNISSLIWGIADDVLRGTFKPNEYGRIILPFVVLRRLDCVLEQDKKQAIEIYNSLKDSIDNPEPAVLNKLKLNFYNVSNYDLEKLKSDPTNIKQNFENYTQGYSENVRDIVKNFNLQPLVDKLHENDKLYLLIDKYTTVDLHPDTVDNHQMGTIYEELLRKFSEMTNEESGDHFTPRDIVQLLVTLVFGPDKENLQGKGLIRTIYDPCCGTGGLLSIGKQWVKENINSDISIELFGQELNDQTYAICKSDQLISGENPENIYGPLSTLTKDQLKDNKFDYIIANPPYGVSWKSEADEIKEEAKDPDGRYSLGLPAISDGSFLFLQHMISKMNPNGSRIGVVFNASPMFQGKAGQGPSEIRKWLFENDYIETIIQLPDRLFFNTGITTYIWILNNKKSKRKSGYVQLIDASNLFSTTKIKLGEKNKEITSNHIQKIFDLANGFNKSEISKIYNNEYFGHTEITINSPLINDSGIQYDSKGNKKVDKSKRDTEKVSLSEDIEEYFQTEILPFRPDSWIDSTKNKIGYDVSFSKEFYSFVELRDLSIIKKELEDLEVEIRKLNEEL
uniref:site-specific DNA-methyltransferase (adenine-specific) n=1 Tax=Candidatus Actinomarina minuta TaxID=1389454 RepID=S5DNJ5_9ACTN|nr:type I restriction-modification system methyltransferase subunit [Candidatus Actinomarina minuta]|tara:strand:+ start:609 stop:2309 length:1701 start_codon:yes stop_codon:yes gene_type:complete